MQSGKGANKIIDQFFEAILAIRDMEECYEFFEDLCTKNELQLIT